MIDLDKLDELHQEGEWDSVAPIFAPEHGCVQCHQPWPCQIARLSQELRKTRARLAAAVERVRMHDEYYDV